LTLCMKESYAGHKHANNLWFQHMVSIMWILIFWSGFLKCIILHKGDSFHWTICVTHGRWQMLVSIYHLITCRTGKKYRRKQGKLVVWKLLQQITIFPAKFSTGYFCSIYIIIYNSHELWSLFHPQKLSHLALYVCVCKFSVRFPWTY
jgi:hypothetical protein